MKTAGWFVLSGKHTQLCDGECRELLWRQTAGELMGLRLSPDQIFFLVGGSGGKGIKKKTLIEDKEKFSCPSGNGVTP